MLTNCKNMKTLYKTKTEKKTSYPPPAHSIGNCGKPQGARAAWPMGGSRAISHCTYEFGSKRWVNVSRLSGRCFVAEGRACRGQVKKRCMFSKTDFQRKMHQEKSCGKVCTPKIQIYILCGTCTFPIGDPPHAWPHWGSSGRVGVDLRSM